MEEKIKGFSKLSKNGKIEWLLNSYFERDESGLDLLKSYSHVNTDIQRRHDDFIENAVTNFYIPFGVAPNFRINGKNYCIPFAILKYSPIAFSPE